jgi:hypothetical protein
MWLINLWVCEVKTVWTIGQHGQVQNKDTWNEDKQKEILEGTEKGTEEN